MMGYSYSDDTTYMCYNPAKSWQLGWYNNKRESLNFRKRGGFNGKLIGVTDYQNTGAAGMYVNIKVDSSTPTDIYVGFNRQAGINSGTKEAANQVTVTTQTAQQKSELVGRLSQGATHTISNFDGTGKKLFVKVNQINTAASPPFADVDIYLEGCPPGTCGAACNSCCANSDCNQANACAVGTCQAGTCSYDTSACPGNFVLKLKTDSDPSETSFQVTDQCNGGVVKVSRSSYPNANTLYTNSATLGQSWYKLTVRDSFGEYLAMGFKLAMLNV